MRDLFLLAIHLLAIHLLVTVAKVLRPGGVRAVAAESLLLEHQMLISDRSRRRAPDLPSLDRFVPGFTTPLVNPQRLARLAAILKPAALFTFHKAVVDRDPRHDASPARKGRRRNSSR